uniref:Proline dehydrogenase n=1 Tax=Xiphophorus couchianus TaxID=32473 RepID=A0A3B5LK77_9TELE
MDLGKKILGQKLFDQLMKMTFYGQFVAGEDHISIKPLIQKNQAFGVGSVLDYSVEEDISQKEETQKERGQNCEGYREKNYEAGEQLGDSQREVIGTCTYFYADEAKCDQHMETFMKCIKASGGSSMDGFSAIKMTALGRPQLLLRFSEVLVKWQRFFTFLSSQQDGMESLEQRLELTQLQVSFFFFFESRDLLIQSHMGKFISHKHHIGSNKILLHVVICIDILDWNSLLDDRVNTSDLLLAPNVKLDKLEPLLKNFTIEDENQLKRTLERLDVLAKCALENDVRLMVDAEQTYFQPAISKLTLDSQKIYNREKPVIFNTYQCYLKEAYKNVTVDVELSRREGWCFAAKLVRGAYMYQERERAEEFRYEDPINPNYESTSTMYHRCLHYVLDEIALNRKANVMVLGLLPAENKVFFGQLLGMCDQISFPLGQAGFPVYKYVPYGPVSEVMPYLSRRAQENQGFMKGAQKERELLWKELKRRLVSGELLYRPVY